MTICSIRGGNLVAATLKVYLGLLLFFAACTACYLGSSLRISRNCPLTPLRALYALHPHSASQIFYQIFKEKCMPVGDSSKRALFVDVGANFGWVRSLRRHKHPCCVCSL